MLLTVIFSETCEKIERSVDELIKLGGTSAEEMVFVRNTIKAIEECLQRETTIKIE